MLSLVDITVAFSISESPRILMTSKFSICKYFYIQRYHKAMFIPSHIPHEILYTNDKFDMGITTAMSPQWDFSFHKDDSCIMKRTPVVYEISQQCSAAEILVKFESDTSIITFTLVASRLHEIIW